MISHPNRSKKAKPITRALASKILSYFDAGLTSGKGNPKKGEMCIEAVVCNLVDGRHSDDPICVSPALRGLKIRLNDASWSSNQARALGMRRLGLVQLGSAGFLDESEFIKRLCDLVIRKVLPGALRICASVHPVEKHKLALIEAATACENDPSLKTAREARQISLEARKAAADAAAAGAYAAKKKSAAKARDGALSSFAEEVVKILISMNVPGVQWLPLTEAA